MNASTRFFRLLTQTLFSLMVLAALSACTPTRPVENVQTATAEPDSGFGGTGKTLAQTTSSDSGFGGTGIIGTIDAFGSIWVNGIEIEYPDNAEIRSNLATQNQLQLGQQVMVETDAQHQATNRIYIHYPLAGKITAVEAQRIRVEDHWIGVNADTYQDNGLKLARGQYVAVSGYQQNGEWVATRLSHNAQQQVIAPQKFNPQFSTRKLLMETRLQSQFELNQRYNLIQQPYERGSRRHPSSASDKTWSKQQGVGNRQNRNNTTRPIYRSPSTMGGSRTSGGMRGHR